MLSVTELCGFGDGTAPEPQWSNVKYALHFDGADGSTTFADVKGHTITPYGNAQIDTAQSMFGGASGLFDGTGDYLASAFSSDLDLLPGIFCISLWARPTQFYTDGERILAIGGGVPVWNSTDGIHVLVQFDPSGALSVEIADGTTNPSKVDSIKLAQLNVWNYITVGYDGANIYAGVDGVVTNGVRSVSRPSTNPTLAIGTIPGEGGVAGYAYSGHIDDLRIIKGECVWKNNFLVPDHAFFEG